MLEHDLLIRLACCVDPKTAEASGIYQKVLRSMDIRQASTDADARSRNARRSKILDSMLRGDQIPDEGIYPGLGERWSRPRDKQTALVIPASSFERLTEKIVRGIYYIEDDIYIEPTHSITFYALDDAGAATIRDILDCAGTEHTSGPGISVKRAVAQDDKVSSLISIDIWKSFKMYASVQPITP